MAHLRGHDRVPRHHLHLHAWRPSKGRPVTCSHHVPAPHRLPQDAGRKVRRRAEAPPTGRVRSCSVQRIAKSLGPPRDHAHLDLLLRQPARKLEGNTKGLRQRAGCIHREQAGHVRESLARQHPPPQQERGLNYCALWVMRNTLTYMSDKGGTGFRTRGRWTSMFSREWLRQHLAIGAHEATASAPRQALRKAISDILGTPKKQNSTAGVDKADFAGKDVCLVCKQATLARDQEHRKGTAHTHLQLMRRGLPRSVHFTNRQGQGVATACEDGARLEVPRLCKAYAPESQVRTRRLQVRWRPCGDSTGESLHGMRHVLPQLACLGTNPQAVSLQRLSRDDERQGQGTIFVTIVHVVLTTVQASINSIVVTIVILLAAVGSAVTRTPQGPANSTVDKSTD
eukprot:PhM_4_TR1321/c3_g1_i5/m.101088